MSQERYPTLPPMHRLITGRVYKLESRNLSYGMWDGVNGFIGIRLKFHSRFLDTEFHWDVEDYGTVEDAIDIGIDVPEAIRADSKALFAFLDHLTEMIKGKDDAL